LNAIVNDLGVSPIGKNYVLQTCFCPTGSCYPLYLLLLCVTQKDAAPITHAAELLRKSGGNWQLLLR